LAQQLADILDHQERDPAGVIQEASDRTNAAGLDREREPDPGVAHRAHDLESGAIQVKVTRNLL